MRFKVNSTGIYAIFSLGFTIPCWIAFMVYSIIGDVPEATFVFAIVGSISLIISVFLAYTNSQTIKDLSVTNFTNSDKTAGLLYQLGLLISVLFIVLGNIFML